VTIGFPSPSARAQTAQLIRRADFRLGELKALNSLAAAQTDIAMA
jgi:hypothetical protein